MRSPAILGLLALAPSALCAQAGGFVATLGVDTVHIERFMRRGNRLEGTIIIRTPETRRIRYAMTFDAEGHPARYEMETLKGDGSPVPATGSAGSLTYARDSVIRESLREGRMETTRIAAPSAPWPTPSVPYIGVSYLMYELAFTQARRHGVAAPDSVLYLLTMHPGQARPDGRRIWLVGGDSAEMDYFGVAKSGYKFDASGQLIRADWTGTTYRYRISRIDLPDLEALAQAWSEADRRGTGLGRLSPRDTARGNIDGVDLAVDYSRPARRGRAIWGDVVPGGKVWRLGADMATQLETSAALSIGGLAVPAGTYTLWILPSDTGRAVLVINSKTHIFGTNYDPSRDFVRLPLTWSSITPPVERLTIAVENGRLWIRWGDGAWWVPVGVK